MAEKKPILLMIEGLPFHREILLGVSAFDGADFPRDLVACRFQHLEHMLRVRRWCGFVAVAASPAIAERLRGLDAPVVNLSMRLAETGLPTVAPDNHAVGRIAAEHFLERGFRTFAYLEFSDAWFSGERHAGFRERLAEAGHDVLPLKKSTFRLAEK